MFQNVWSSQNRLRDQVLVLALPLAARPYIYLLYLTICFMIFKDWEKEENKVPHLKSKTVVQAYSELCFCPVREL